MKNNSIDNPWQIVGYSTFGALILGIATYLGYLCHLNLATAGFLCLVVVVLLSSFGSMTSSAVHSIVAVGWLDYFFAPPVLSLRVSDPRNILALAAFLTTSLGITFQVTRVRRERQLTAHERNEVKRLYELARQLMTLKLEDIDTPRLLALFRDVFALRAVCLYENKTASSCIIGEPRYDLETRTRMGYLAGEDTDDTLCRTSVRCLRMEGKDTGVLGFEWPDSEAFTPDSLSTLETTMLERVRAFHTATQAAVTAQAESLRIMLLDALAHAVKGGSNAFHGSLFEYLQNDALDADTHGFGTKAPKRYNDFGGSVGGPVKIPHLYNGHDKTFYFFDYEGNRRSTSYPEYLLVPTLAQRQGNLTGLPIANTNGALANPLPAGYACSGTQFTNNTIPTQCLNPTALALLNSYYPLPTPGLDGATLGYNYQALVRIPGNSNGLDLRVDQNIGSRQQVYARLSWKNLLTNTWNQLLPDDSDVEHDRSFLASHNYAMTSSLVNEFRFGFTHSLINPDFPIEGTQALNQLGFQTGSAPGQVNTTNHPTQGGFPSISFSDGTGFSTIGRDITGVLQSNTKQVTDNITWSKGHHTIRAGVDYRIVNYVTPSLETASDDFGLFTFNQGIFTGSSFGDLLLGLPNTTYFAVTGPRDDGTAHEYGFYGQDQWEINNRLTVNAGLRYEYLPGFQDQIGNMANFLPSTNTVIIPDILAKGYGAVPAFLQSFNSCSLPDRNMSLACSNFETASQAGMPQSLRQNYKFNFDPRIGLAYRPFSGNKTVVRAGFGVFTVTNLGPLAFNMSSNPTASVHTFQNNNNGVPLFQFPQALTPAQSVQYGGGALEQGDAQNYRDPQVIQWNLTVEREITPSTAAHVRYVGMEGHRQNVTIDLNQIPENTQGYNVPSGGWVDPRAPFQNWAQIYQSANLGSTSYHACQAGATHRVTHGLTLQGDYSWTKSLSDVQGDAPTGFAIESYYGYAVSDRFHVSADRGNVEGTPRRRLLATGTYALPFGSGRMWSVNNRILNAALGGWNLNTVSLFQTGPWLTPTMSPADDTSGVGIAARGTIARPDRVPGVSTIPAHRTATDYFNINAFTTNTLPGHTGDAAVGSLEGPGTMAVGAGIAKEFSLRESVKMRFESTFTNVINRANFAVPATDVSNPSTFGVLTQVQTANDAGNRTGQVALRINF